MSVGRQIFERCARRALRALWRMRTPLGLFGTSLDMMQGIWLDNNGGIGASADSFYEYLLKAYILFGACHAVHAHWLDFLASHSRLPGPVRSTEPCNSALDPLPKGVCSMQMPSKGLLYEI